MLMRQCAAAVSAVGAVGRPEARRMIGIGTGGNRYHELLAATHELRKLEQKDWDVCAGISAGSLVAAMISQIKKGDYGTFDHDFTKARENFLQDHNASPFQPRYPLGQYFNAVLCMVFGKPSLYKGMSAFVNQEFDEDRFKKAGRQLLIGVYDNETQSYKTVDSRKATTNAVRQAIIASCSIPVAMPVQSVDGIGRCRDGGLVHCIPVRECIHFIKENTREGVQSHIDLLISDAIQTPPTPRPGEPSVTSSLLDATVSRLEKPGEGSCGAVYGARRHDAGAADAAALAQIREKKEFHEALGYHKNRRSHFLGAQAQRARVVQNSHPRPNTQTKQTGRCRRSFKYVSRAARLLVQSCCPGVLSTLLGSRQAESTSNNSSAPR